MVVSDKHKYLFISTPKSGTHTMYHVLENSWGGKRHGGYHNVSLPHYYKKYELFTTVRNPYDRVVSAHYILTNVDDYAKKFLPVIGGKDLLTFMKWLYRYPNDREARGKGFAIVAPQVARIKHIQNVKYLKLENIQQEFQTLNFVNREQTFPQLLKRKHQSWDDLKTPDIEEMVYAYYKEDFDVLGYERDTDLK